MVKKPFKNLDFFGKNFVSIYDHSLEDINYILDKANFIQNNKKKFKNSLKGSVMVPLFFENSTRTSSSFQMAMLKMGGSVLDFDVERSSVKKGERLIDTLRTIEAYEPEVIVIRHNLDGSARLAGNTIQTPVINAGDGKNEHPTQTLLDLYTIKQIRGDINGTKIVIAGDLKYGRTVHSLASSLSMYDDCELTFVSPDILKMPNDITNLLTNKKTNYTERSLNDLEDSIVNADIVYMTRVQRERFPQGLEGENDYKKVCKDYCLKNEMLKNVKPNFKIMHPLPRVNEIDLNIDKTKYPYYFQQISNGMYVRMALIDLILNEAK
jgi:aspartate carbamoyltransferase catalytic subunit